MQHTGPSPVLGCNIKITNFMTNKTATHGNFDFGRFFCSWSCIRVGISIYCFRLCRLPSIRTSDSILVHTNKWTAAVYQRRYTLPSPPINEHLQNDSHTYSQNPTPIKKHTPEGVCRKSVSLGFATTLHRQVSARDRENTFYQGIIPLAEPILIAY